MKEHIEAITDLLLGAAHADREFVGHEVVTIRSVIAKMYGQRTLPPDRVAQVKGFDPEAFDLQKAAAGLADLAKDQRMRVLELVSMVIESDGVIDLDEDQYLRDVAKALGFAEDEIGGLALEVDEDFDYSLYFDE